MTHRESAALLVASMLLLSVSSVLMPSEVYERFSNPDSTTAQDLSSLSSEEPPSTLDIHPDAGPDIVAKEGSTVSLDGTRSYQDDILRVWDDSFDNLTKVDSYVNVTIESGSVHLNDTSFAIEETFAVFSGFQLEDDQALTQLWWDPMQEVLAWHSDIDDPIDTWEKLVKSTPFEVTDRFDFIGHVDYVYTNAQTQAEVFPFLFMDVNSIRVTDLHGPTSDAIDFSIYGGNPTNDRHALRFYDGSGTQHNTLNVIYDSHFNERIQAEVRFDSQTRTLEAKLQDHFGSTLGIGTSLIPPGAFSLSKFGIGAMGRDLSGTSDGYSDNMTIAAWGYNDGEVVSVQIDPQEPFENWSWLDINSVEPSGTDIKVDILDEFGLPLVTNIDSDDCPFSLSGLIDPVMHPRIVLKASLTTTWNETPLLLDWNVSYSIPSPLTFSWDINDLEDGNSDGNFTNDADLTGPFVFYQYGDDGAYSVTLTINNTFGNVSTDSCVVDVVNEKPSLSVTFPASLRVGLPLTFDASASDPGSDDLTFMWDWGDGSNESQTFFNDGMGPDPPNSPDVNPMTVVDQWNHTYGYGGTYLVNLTVVDDEGGSTTETYELTLFSAEAGFDQVVNEGETVQLSGSGSEGSSLDYYWSDDFDDVSRISESVNITVDSGSVVLANLSFSISHSFETDPGFVLEDDMPNTELWWDPVNERLRWYVDREDPQDHYEKLVGFLPFPVTNAMDISASVDYLYWRADRWAVADPLLLQKNGSWRLGTKFGPNNNTAIMRIYGGDPLMGDVDKHAGFMWDDPGTSFQIYEADYDMHYWELFTSRIAWDSDTETMYGEVRDPVGTLVGSGLTVISENFTFHKYGMGSYGHGRIDDDPHIGEGFADNYSISAFGYRTPGWVTSEVITAPGPSGAWGVLNVSAVEPIRTQIDIQVLDEFGTPIVSGIRPSDCPLSLDGLIDPATYPKIMLKAVLSTDRNETPALMDWNVSYHAQNPIISYQWDVNQFVDLDSDGNYTNDVDLAGENVSYIYGDNGLYIVHLTVLDSTNETTVDSCDITVLNVAPTANISCPVKVSIGYDFRCYSGATDPGSDDLTFDWDWGDGSTHNVSVHYNNGIGPDPDPSPGPIHPFLATDTAVHAYSLLGNHTVVLNVSDDDGGNVLLQFEIWVVELPETTIVVGDPKYVSTDFFITSSTPISFSVMDRSGEGIESTYYRIDGGVWTQYVAPFNVPDEGAHTIYYNSTDLLGGAEATRNFDLVVDNTPPSSTVIVGTPNYTGVDLWITPSTTLTITSGDSGCGLSSVEYELDGGGWQAYSAPFTVQPEGSHSISFRGSDNLGNVESEQSIALIVDGTPPSSTITIGQPREDLEPVQVYEETPFTLTSVDAGCGVKVIQYKLDYADWTNYTSSFNLTGHTLGTHTIQFRGLDNLGNVEDIQSLTIELIEPERLEENLKLLIAIVFAIILAIVGLLVTLKRPFVSEDGEQRRGFTFLAIALPFVLVEIFTGILSLFVPAIEVPPWFGLGMILDLAILITGVVVELVVFVKNKSPGEEEEETEGDAAEETE